MHEIESAFYAKQPAWHGLGVVVSETKNSNEAIQLAGLNWLVESQPLYLKNGMEIEERKANVRNIDLRILGIVSDNYRIV